MSRELDAIHAEIAGDPANAGLAARGYEPLWQASARSRIVIVGQAPGRRAQASGVPWDDASGVRLRSWLGVSDEEFYDPDRIALVPMDFYYPGKGEGGDLPPRPDFAPRWHPRILALMTEVRLTVLVGAYAQKHYLGPSARGSLTETVRARDEYAPSVFPLVHPSPLNFRWHGRNPWFELEVIPELRRLARRALAEPGPVASRGT